MRKLATILVSLVLTLSLLPVALSVDTGTGVGIDMETEQFAPMVWMCDSRIVLDDSVETGTEEGPGWCEHKFGQQCLVERQQNYAFEGEQIAWNVLVMDKNGAEKAFAYGKKLGLRETTLRSWFSQFRKVAASRKANGKAHAKALAA